MASNLVADHAANLIDGTEMDITRHVIAGATGAIAGRLGDVMGSATKVLGNGALKAVTQGAVTVPAAGVIGVVGGALNARIHGDAYIAAGKKIDRVVD